MKKAKTEEDYLWQDTGSKQEELEEPLDDISCITKGPHPEALIRHSI